MVVYVEKSTGSPGIILIPASTEPSVRVDARWPLSPGDTFGGLTFEQISEASVLELDAKGVATVTQKAS